MHILTVKIQRKACMNVFNLLHKEQSVQAYHDSCHSHISIIFSLSSKSLSFFQSPSLSLFLIGRNSQPHTCAVSAQSGVQPLSRRVTVPAVPCGSAGPGDPPWWRWSRLPWACRSSRSPAPPSPSSTAPPPPGSGGRARGWLRRGCCRGSPPGAPPPPPRAPRGSARSRRGRRAACTPPG